MKSTRSPLKPRDGYQELFSHLAGGHTKRSTAATPVQSQLPHSTVPIYMTEPIKLHLALQSLGITEVTIHTDEGDFYYIALSATEFQFGREGDILTNYTVG